MSETGLFTQCDTKKTTQPIKVLFFAALREAIGHSELQLSIAGPLQIKGVLALVSAQCPKVQRALAGGEVLAAVNQHLVGSTAWVSPGDEVALFPPVTGG